MKKILGIAALGLMLAGTVWCSKKEFDTAEKNFKEATVAFLNKPKNDKAKKTLLKAFDSLALKTEAYFEEPKSFNKAQSLMYKYDKELNDLTILTLSKALNQEQIINKTALELKTAIFGAIKNKWETDPIIEQFKKILNDALKPQQQEPEKQKTERKKKLKEEQKELVELTDAKDIQDIKQLKDQLENIKKLSEKEVKKANQKLIESFYATAYDAVGNYNINKLKWVYALLPEKYKQGDNVDAIFTDLENKQPLLVTAITKITALQSERLLTKDKERELATGIPVYPTAMAIIKFLVETVGVRTTRLLYGKTKVDAIALAIQRQYKPIVEYFIEQDDLTAKQIPGIFEFLFASPITTYCYYEVKNSGDPIEYLKFDDVRELVTQIGYYPCLSLVIDNLIKNNVDLTTIKINVGVLSERMLPLIDYILYKLGLNNLTDKADLDKLPAKAFYELILKLYNLMNENDLFQFTAPTDTDDLLYQGLNGLKTFINEDKFAIDKNGNPINPITDKTALKKKISKALSEEKLYNAIADGNGEKIKKLLKTKINFTQKERYLKYYDCKCPIIPWLLYYLNKHDERETFPSDKLSDIILKRYKDLKNKNPKIPVKKHKEKFFEKLNKGFQIVKEYADKNDLKIGNLEDITNYRD